ncbi:MAG: hypothetical protein ACKVS8_06715 [Phycisphaerales bacterium]
MSTSGNGTGNGHTQGTLKVWDWQPQPKAWKLVNELVDTFLKNNAPAAALAARMKNETGTRFVDWIDHIAVADEAALRPRLLDAGFEHKPVPHGPGQYVCDKGMFPPVLLGPCGSMTMFIAIKVERVNDFLAAQGLPLAHEIEGPPPGSQMRMAPHSRENGYELWAIERHGLRGYDYDKHPAEKLIAAQRHQELITSRKRDFGFDDAAGFAEANRVIDAAIADLGRDWACDLFFQGERDYWMRRNAAARFQYARQARLGLGWANHDHHTYRSSRAGYRAMIAFLEKLGFFCRERFYAGAEAGWGAQVLEQPETGVIIFADVDMSPEELMGDFPHIGLPARADKHLGTIGLWCELHGEAFLQAGMHHLEAMFDWHTLKAQMQAEGGIRTMDPFTTFPYLRQAFTEGEKWAVRPERIGRLLANGQITPEQAEMFRTQGALGSHLENLERNDGFKGFNQTGVSQIIAKTDPRRLAAAGA